MTPNAQDLTPNAVPFAIADQIKEIEALQATAAAEGETAARAVEEQIPILLAPVTDELLSIERMAAALDARRAALLEPYAERLEQIDAEAMQARSEITLPAIARLKEVPTLREALGEALYALAKDEKAKTFEGAGDYNLQVALTRSIVPIDERRAVESLKKRVPEDDLLSLLSPNAAATDYVAAMVKLADDKATEEEIQLALAEKFPGYQLTIRKVAKFLKKPLPSVPVVEGSVAPTPQRPTPNAQASSPLHSGEPARMCELCGAREAVGIHPSLEFKLCATCGDVGTGTMQLLPLEAA